MRSIIRKILPAKINNKISLFSQREYVKIYYSGCGEDVILNYLFKEKNNGFYVDVGACEPVRFSNTYIFYLKGWNGINIEAMPGSMDSFKEIRPRDINIEAAVSNTEEPLTYYEIGGAKSMNSFSLDFIKDLGAENSITNKIKIKPIKFSQILNDYLPQNQIIDFLTIDVEGLELEVLKSNNWEKYRPRIISLESFEKMNENNFDSEIIAYLDSVSYKILSKTVTSLFFIEKSEKLNKTNQIEN